MRLRATEIVLVVLLALSLPAAAEFVSLPKEVSAVPGEYLVFPDGERGPSMESLAAYATIGVREVRSIPLENFPSGKVVRMSVEAAERLGEDGYLVVPNYRRPILGSLQTQEGVFWHLDRDDQRALPLNGTYSYSYSGRGVTGFILDTGFFAIPEFADRISLAKDFIGDGLGVNAACGGVGTHGTFVSDMFGGALYGVAKDANLILLRVVACDEHMVADAYYQALDYIVTWARQNPGKRAVMNMSFGGPGFVRLDDTYFRAIYEAGVVLVDAAANSNIDTCIVGPAASVYTITAGGSNKTDHRWAFSNWGRCVDVFAPTENVSGLAGPDEGGSRLWTGVGTSLAAPQVAGHIAQLLEQYPKATPAQIKAMLVANATPGVLKDIGVGSPNRLLFTGVMAEVFTKLDGTWVAAKKRFTVDVRIGLRGGSGSPAEWVALYRGLTKDGKCQGKPFASVTLAGGAGTASVSGWAKPPAALCATTSLGTVYTKLMR